MRQELLSIHLAVEVLSELSTTYDSHLQEHDRAAQFGGYVPIDDDLPVEVPLRLLRLAQSSISKEPVSAITFKDEGDFINRKSRFEIDECLVTVCGSNAPTVARNIAQEYLDQAPPPADHVMAGDAVDKARAWDAAQASYGKGFAKATQQAISAVQTFRCDTGEFLPRDSLVSALRAALSAPENGVAVSVSQDGDHSLTSGRGISQVRPPEDDSTVAPSGDPDFREIDAIDVAAANIRADYRAGKISKEQFRKELLIVSRARQQENAALSAPEAEG